MDSATSLPFTLSPNASPVTAQQRAQILANPGFGRVFTDNMVVIRYQEGRGWHDARVQPFAPLALNPACAVLHYAQEIFEGMKAYRTAESGITLFRPYANAARFAKSAARLAMPEVPEEVFVEAVRQLVRVDHAWVPDKPDESLYIRPFMIANETFLGVKPASEYLFMVIASPVGAYFGEEAVSVWVSDFCRAAPGGTGEAKCGGNYAASLLAQQEAKGHGCAQVLFLDAVERRWIEEMGGMNVFFVFDDGSLATPPLTGTILRGITRDSLLTLARAQGLTVREEPYAIDQLYADAASGRLKEVFACGTAAVVSPIGRFRGPKGDAVVGKGQGIGPVTAKLRSALIAIQRGTAPDPHNWVEKVI
ncbi:branched-chain amino acid aminotransferase [Komagataeibacter medellinensis]|uniref:Branched-chain-amino-acid aminotransferase n=1 Tax=Komagataeibacter medellinensis (strain NBRC 3288 / BCRC 11682 / LMG 1693 / Kondo 51) TaxID=634177 RepID=G2I0G1_KOMMN|nr:branched-chain amino acid aminotransferase [Komagataeibacter medellinensis]BAK84419.1 branched-chain amino acid aminotransferase [Komagataeibacter medellinensis NBRC 3288]